MERLSAWIYRRFRHRAVYVYLGMEVVSAFVITLGAIGILSLYQDMTTRQYWLIVAFCCVCVLTAAAAGALKLRSRLEPLLEWMHGRRDEELAREAWQAAVTSPPRLVTDAIWWQIAFIHIPAPVFIVVLLGLPVYSVAIIAAASVVTSIYAAILHFFYSEVALRPVLRDVARCLPPVFAGQEVGVSLRWKLMGALPLINLITGVVVSGLSGSGSHSLNDLGVSVIVAVTVACTLSLELSFLVTRSVMMPLGDLLGVIPRVKEGDFTARVPVVSGDEMGRLARNFNDMVGGLEERERLREAFGSYVDPDVAERVLEEGATIEGEEVEVTVVFIDIVDFTSFAENASARETVDHLNEFFDVVVPVLLRCGGHANKYVGDGVMGVFGAPQLLPDHAERAVAAAREIDAAVRERYGEALRIGIGVNSGPVSAGTIGGGGRLEFTVIGDPVNVAARVEAATRDTGDRILVTESTRALMSPRSAEHLQPRGALPVRGRSEPVTIYAPEPAGAVAPRSDRTAYGSSRPA